MNNVCEILKSAKTIAVVGISDKPERDSYEIARYLQKVNYNVVGVNPFIKNVNDMVVYPGLTDIPFKVDIVNVFRRSDKIIELVDDVIKIKPKVFWLQLGINNDDAVEKIAGAGIEVIRNLCIKVEHRYCSAQKFSNFI
jgi:predicted CoA-binding protein